MTALSINTTDRDTPATWADIAPNIHPLNILEKLSMDLWKLSVELEDCVTGNRKVTRADISILQDTAQGIDDYVKNKQYDEIQFGKVVMQEEGLP